MPDTDKTVAALIALAEGIKAGIIPTPDSIDLWNHRVTGENLLRLADQFDAKVNIARTNDGEPVQAALRVPLAADGIDIEYYPITTDVSPVQIADYETHNAECIVQTAS